MASDQLSLFSTQSPADNQESQAARVRMLGMLARLRAASVPPWANETEVILDDGAFRRAMRFVPAAEGESLWADYNGEVDRLYPQLPAGRPSAA